MPCEHYREGLTETVAADSALSRELLEHLEGCPTCREFFAQEQQLFGGIDSGVRGSANAEVPPSVLARIRAGLNEQQVPRRSWFPLGATLVSTAVLLTIILFVRGHERHRSEPNPQANTVARGAAPEEAPLVSRPAVASRTQTGPHGIRHQRPHVPFVSAVPRDEVRVLIPPGQKEAVDALLIALRTGALNGDLLVAGKAQKPSQGGELLPLSISPIEIQPLAPVSEESAPESEKENIEPW